MSETAYAKSGHNVVGIDSDRLVSIVNRYERLDEEVKALRSDQKDILIEAKSAGYDPKILRQLFRIRKLDPKDHEEQQTILAAYQRAMGD